MKKILITGIAGFAGSFLAEHFIKKGNIAVYGTTLSLQQSPNLENLKQKITLLEANLMDAKKVAQVIADVRPDSIFHLAALAAASQSFARPAETLTNNIAAQVNILESIRILKGYYPKILIVSSADIYGNVSPQNLPIDEETPLNPTNPYAVSKIAQDYMALQYFNSYALPIIRVRPFNHIGPRQAVHFVISDFAKRIVEIENGKEAILRVGNVTSKRDFTDVRDMVKAYDLILTLGKAGDVYNIGTGISYSISDVLQKLLSFSKEKIAVSTDPKLIRPSDTPELVCDPAKIKTLTGWNPEIPLEITLKDTLDYWRQIA